MKIEYRVQPPSVISTQVEIIKRINDGTLEEIIRGDGKLSVFLNDQCILELDLTQQEQVRQHFEQLVKQLKELSSKGK